MPDTAVWDLTETQTDRNEQTMGNVKMTVYRLDNGKSVTEDKTYPDTGIALRRLALGMSGASVEAFLPPVRVSRKVNGRKVNRNGWLRQDLTTGSTAVAVAYIYPADVAADVVEAQALADTPELAALV